MSKETLTTKCKVRAYKTMFTRPQLTLNHRVNVGTIGHVDHGKTTLQSAIQSVLGRREDQRYLHGRLFKPAVKQSDLSKKHLYQRGGLR